MKADPDGELAQIQMGQRGLEDNFAALHGEIRQIVGDNSGPGSIAAITEVELDCDYNLKFQYVIKAVTAISGYLEGEGPNQRVVKVIEKIKFSPPKAPR